MESSLTLGGEFQAFVLMHARSESTAVEYVGPMPELLEKLHVPKEFRNMTEWSREQRMDDLRNRNGRFYVPSFPESYGNFAKDRYRHVTADGPAGQFGLGEEADLITLLPLFNVNNTHWVYRNYLINYSFEDKLKPRQASIVLTGRLSRRLLMEMHHENQDAGHAMAAEMWPATIALENGFKAVYVPHPIYMERLWPADILQAVFNAGPNAEVGGPLSGVINHEHNFEGSTWYYSNPFSPDIYHRWMGLATNGPGSDKWERKHGPRASHILKSPLPLKVYGSLATSSSGIAKDREDGVGDCSENRYLLMFKAVAMRVAMLAAVLASLETYLPSAVEVGYPSAAMSWLDFYAAELLHQDILSAVLTARNVAALFYLWLGYKLLQAAWNVSPLHPLCHVPGPRLSAATYLPEFYYEVILSGRNTNRIKKLHEIYGPIVRINPHEMHCNDAKFIDEIFAVGGRKRNKPEHQVRNSVISLSGFATADHDHHRLRRLPLAKYFSRGHISQLEPVIQKLVQKLCSKLLGESGKQGPLNVTMAYSCFTSDVISDFCYGQSFGFLDQDTWEPNFLAPLHAQLKTAYISKYFPIAYVVKASSWFLKYMPEDMALMFQTLMIDIPNQIKKVHANMDAGVIHDRPTVFETLLSSDLPPQEKTLDRLTDEAAALLGAGTETTAWALSVLTYHLLAKPKVLARLTQELREAVEDPQRLPPWTALEKLPYLGAVIYEGLRLSYGIASRTARTAPDEDLVYRGEWTPRGRHDPVPVQYVIPRGFGIGMSSPITHHDESLFADSWSFIPERWLDKKMQRRKELERALLSFSKGSRGCLGISLAFCELYLALTALTLRVFPHMCLFETTEEDVSTAIDGKGTVMAGAGAARTETSTSRPPAASPLPSSFSSPFSFLVVVVAAAAACTFLRKALLMSAAEGAVAVGAPGTETGTRGDGNRDRGNRYSSSNSSSTGTGGDVDRGADPLANNALHKQDVVPGDDAMLVQDDVGLGELFLRGDDGGGLCGHFFAG
ncbi:hypothetical protein DL766_010005 [Monosporascus sp. MC13-8B]|nr:hypothetical protein DL763_009728 [Monosporascus cannonballus]RYP11962.1 hypothetical protein DL766_010005 [Monosporascus sp. MC13-8B]